jgi:hypothetical protein
MSRAYTAEEMRDAFMRHAVDLVAYWSVFPDARIREGFKLPEADIPSGIIEAYMRHAAEGVLFSLLTSLDGDSMAMPACDIIPRPHPNAEAFHKGREENWWVSEAINADCHLHGLLHHYRGK